jgi:uncharacterized membrane protein
VNQLAAIAYGGEVVHTSVSTRDEQRVREALAEGADTVGGSV